MAPTTVDEAVQALAAGGGDAKVVAGGQSLLPMMKLRLAAPGTLVDINGIAGLDVLEEADGMLRIGALVRHGDLERSDLIRDRYPIIHDAARHIADPLIRNRGTFCGSIAHGDPAGDWATVASALNAERPRTAIDPTSGSEILVDETTPTAEHEGVTYYFSCNGCKGRFLEDPARYVGAAPTA